MNGVFSWWTPLFSVCAPAWTTRSDYAPAVISNVDLEADGELLEHIPIAVWTQHNWSELSRYPMPEKWERRVPAHPRSLRMCGCCVRQLYSPVRTIILGEMVELVTMEFDCDLDAFGWLRSHASQNARCVGYPAPDDFLPACCPRISWTLICKCPQIHRHRKSDRLWRSLPVALSRGSVVGDS
jgi:hypothetical protein